MNRSRRPVHELAILELPILELAVLELPVRRLPVLCLALGVVLTGCASPVRPGEDYAVSGRMDAARRASAEAAEDWNGFPQDSRGALFLEDYRDRQGDGFGPGPWGLP